MPSFYGGLEGGGTNTRVVILNSHGVVVGSSSGGGSNGWVLGVEPVVVLVAELVQAAKAAAGVPLDVPLVSLGACMSGFLQPRMQAALEAGLRARDPHLATSYYIDNDTPGSVLTALGPGGAGCVLIAGTGSMGQWVGRDGTTRNAGGWGHMFGDEGSAYYLAAKAIRGVFRGLDGTLQGVGGAPPPDVTAVHAAMLSYFGVTDKDGMLDVFYKDFSKARVAGFAVKLAGLASPPIGDPFAASICATGGAHLGRAVRAMAPSARTGPGDVTGLTVVVVGSVWKSWPLMQEAFTAAATAPFSGSAAPGELKSFRLVQLREGVTSALGAAWAGAARAGVTLPADPTSNTATLAEWPKRNSDRPLLSIITGSPSTASPPQATPLPFDGSTPF